MAVRQGLRLRMPVAAVVLGGVAALYPNRTAFAEAPPKDTLPAKKPIYSDGPILPAMPKPSASSPVSQPSSTSPTPTDRLTDQVKRARFFLYEQSLTAEHGVNSFMSWVLRKETSFANTVASLAPAPESGEQLLPGVIYVLVATMAGSIASRNRGIFVRASFPLAVGIATGWTLIPVTMQNIADLSWEYEKKVPFISETHAQIRGFTIEAWRQSKIRAKAATDWADNTASAARAHTEDWVKSGK